MIRNTAFFVLMLLLMTGCNRSRGGRDKTDELQSYSELPSARQTSYQPLRDEIDRILSEKGTPSQLDQKRLEEAREDLKRNQIATATAIMKIYPPARRMRLSRARRLMPQGRFQFDPVALEKVRDYLIENQTAWNQFRKLLARPNVDLDLSFELGALTNYEIVDSLRQAAYVESFQVARCLDDEDYHGATMAAKAVLRIANWLNRQHHLVTRVAGAQLRIDAVRLFEAIARNPRVDRKQVEKLFEAMEAELAYWPKEKRVWMAERAHGLHLYEVIRDGHLTSVMPKEEARRMKTGAAASATFRAVMKNIDQDQLFYLQVMRKIIDSCKLPYYQRDKILRALREDLGETKNTSRYPFVADRLLLNDFEAGHRWLAQERALCEACSLALAVAAGAKTPPSYKVNALTGKSYDLKKTGVAVRISDLTIGDRNFTIDVPIRP